MRKNQTRCERTKPDAKEPGQMPKNQARCERTRLDVKEPGQMRKYQARCERDRPDMKEPCYQFIIDPYAKGPTSKSEVNLSPDLIFRTHDLYCPLLCT